MGGSGSGRGSAMVTAEAAASYVITANILTGLQPGQFAKGTFHFDGGSFAVTVLAVTGGASGPFIELIHQTRDEREGDRVVRDRVRLVSTTPTYGGRRWWFECPKTGRRTNKLFLPNGGCHFWSRRAYGLGYACQREDRLGRRQRKAMRLNRQLGGQGWRTWDQPPAKPKWMRWPTYERTLAAWQQAVDKASAEFELRAEQPLARLNRRKRALIG